MSSVAVHSLQFENRMLNLLPVLFAQQLILWPLYFYLPVWIGLVNSAVALIVYFGLIKGKLTIPVWLKVLVTIVAVAGVLISFQRLSGRDAGVALIAIMYGLKILEIKSRRDVYVLMLLGFFIQLSGFLFNQSPLMAAYQFIPILAILNALTSINSINSSSRLIRVSSLLNIRQLSKYLILALPLMLILFVFFPRLAGPIWKMPGGTAAGSGISDTMSPGGISSLQLFDKVAFRVKFSDRVPHGYQMYWRMLVLDHFDGLTWSRSPTKSVTILDADDHPSRTSDVVEQIISYDISLEKTNQRWLPTLDRPVEIPAQAKLLPDYSTSVRHRITDRTRYRAESDMGLVINRYISKEEQVRHTRLPSTGNQRSLSWAVTERTNYASDREYIQALLSRINNQEYFYTLSPPIMKQDTVDSFWFDEKKGFCEHYSGAFVFMARAAGIPARVVIGYQGAEKNPLSDYWIVRYANAHAWIEVWLEGEGWLRVDPTSAIAPHRIEEDLRQDYSQRESLFGEFGFDAVDLQDISLYKQFQYWLDQANSGWNDWVLDYNQDNQRKLFEGLGFKKLSSNHMSFLMIILLAIFLMVVSFKWLKQSHEFDLIEKYFLLLNQKLLKKGILLGKSMTVDRLVSEIEVNSLIHEKSKTEVISLLKTYNYLRYAGKSDDENTRKDFIHGVKALKIRSN